MKKDVDSQGVPWVEILSRRELIKLLDVKDKDHASGRPDRKGVRTHLPAQVKNQKTQ